MDPLEDDARRILKIVAEGEASCAVAYDRARKDLTFASGLSETQYGEADLKLRGDGRVRQQFPILNQYIERIIGGYDSAPYRVQVSPLNAESAPMAAATQGIVDAIESKSDAKSAFRMALRNAATCGFGWLHCTTAWASDTDESGDVDVTIEPVRDPISVILDPASIATDGRDAEWAAAKELISIGRARALYGDEVLEPGVGATDSAALDEEDEKAGRRVEVVTYYERSKESREVTLPDGRKKKVRAAQVELWRLVHGHVVEHRVLFLSRLPIVPVYGLPVRDQDADSWTGIVHRAKDAQRNLNFCISTGAERLALSPTAKIFAADEAIAGREKIYADANRSNRSVLPYRAFTDDGRPLPPPVKIDPAQSMSDISSQFQLYTSAIASVVGIPADGIGQAPGRQQTAEETLTRARAAETVLSTIYENLATSVRAVGRVIVELIAENYLGTRSYMTVEKGKMVQRVGDFDAVPLDPRALQIDVEAGPLLGTQRKENLRAFLALGAIAPEQFRPLIFSQVVDLMDSADPEFKGVVKQMTAQAMAQMQQGAVDQQAMAAENQRLKQELLQAQQALIALQANSRDAELKSRTDLLRQQMSDAAKVKVETIKQTGADGRAVLDIQAQQARDVAEAEADLARIEAERRASIERALVAAGL